MSTLTELFLSRKASPLAFNERFNEQLSAARVAIEVKERAHWGRPFAVEPEPKENARESLAQLAEYLLDHNPDPPQERIGILYKICACLVKDDRYAKLCDRAYTHLIECPQCPKNMKNFATKFKTRPFSHDDYSYTAKKQRPVLLAAALA